MSNTTKASFWDFKNYSETQWFKTLGRGLLYLVALYFMLHTGFGISDFFGWTKTKLDYEYATLSDDQKQQINRIYFDTTQEDTSAKTSIAVKQSAAPKKANLKDSLVRQKETGLAAADSGSADESKSVATTQINKQLISAPGSSSFKLNKAIRLISNEFNNKIDPVQLDSIKAYLANATDLEATSYLADARFQVKSYFWLTGPAVYFEIIFWSVFGVISSLLFSLGLIGKNSTTIPNNPKTEFDSSEVPYQFAKILYAPICTLVIVLGYNYFNNDNIADISSGKGVIVFAFIGGFYSSRVIALLDRLKEVVLPGDANGTAPGANAKGQVNTTTTTATTEAYNPQVDPPPPVPDEKDITETPEVETKATENAYKRDVDAPPPPPDETTLSENNQEETGEDIDSEKKA